MNWQCRMLLESFYIRRKYSKEESRKLNQLLMTALIHHSHSIDVTIAQQVIIIHLHPLARNSYPIPRSKTIFLEIWNQLFTCFPGAFERLKFKWNFRKHFRLDNLLFISIKRLFRTNISGHIAESRKVLWLEAILVMIWEIHGKSGWKFFVWKVKSSMFARTRSRKFVWTFVLFHWIGFTINEIFIID